MIWDSSRAPILAHIEHVPTHAVLTTVGNISAVNMYTMAKAAEIPSLPILANTKSPIR